MIYAQTFLKKITGRSSKLSIVAMFMVAQLMPLAVYVPQASADGNGSIDACLNTTSGVVGSITGSASLVAYDAGANNVVQGVCIKSGNDTFGGVTHSEVLSNGVFDNGCYQVAGVNTQNVTVTRLVESNVCKDISHVDAVISPVPVTPQDPENNPFVRVSFICKANFNGTALAFNGSSEDEVAVSNGDYIFRVRYESANSDTNAPATVPYATTQFVSSGTISQDQVIFETTDSPVAGVKVTTTPTNLSNGTASTNEDQLCEEQAAPKATVKVTKFNDANNNGVFDEDETTLPGWEMTITEQCTTDTVGLLQYISTDEYSEAPVCETVYRETTQTDGVATFDDVENGYYQLTETMQDGWTQTALYCEQSLDYVLQTSFSEIYNDSFFANPKSDVMCYVGNYLEPTVEEPEQEENQGSVLGTKTTKPTVTQSKATASVTTPQVLSSTGLAAWQYALTGALLVAGASGTRRRVFATIE